MKYIMQLSLAASFSYVVTAAGIPRGFPYVVGQGVLTSSGLVVGHAGTHQSDVSEYLGIPFAKPPVGILRFAAPQGFIGRSIIHANNFSPSCPSVAVSIGNPSSLAGPSALRVLTAISVSGAISEDCLTLNIWSKPQTGEKAKAVLLWIYGGAFTSGSTQSPIYNGEYLAEREDVVVVSANYRVNVFGFPGLPGYDQNVGLQDQRLAVRWVQKNIAAFGGDPKRITIFGQSAGGASVDFYSYAWAQDPIVNGFIEQSGTVRGFSPSGIAANNSESWFAASEKLGCGGASVGIPSSLACVRGKNFTAVLNATASGTFTPTVDEKIIFSDYPARAAVGRFAKKPYLMGNADYEAGVFRLALSGISDDQWDILNLLSFTCPAADASKARSAVGVPIWRYRWFGNFPNLRLSYVPDSRAWHGSELPIVFGTSVDVSGVANTPAETSITAYIQKAWATFAKNPTSGLSTAPFSWPCYDPSTASLVRLAFDNQTAASFVTASTYDAGCAALTGGS